MRSIAFHQELWREVRYGEYIAKCGCCKSFRAFPDDIEPKAKYDNLVRQAVLDRILKDKLNATALRQAMERDFFLKLSTGFIYDCHLIVTKQSNIKRDDLPVLDELLSLSPALGTLRAFVNDMQELFALRRSTKQAWKIWRKMRRNRSYLNNEHLRKALDVLTKENMTKLLVYLDRPSSTRSKVRTNNHVERCNRVLRRLEKVRYKWRRRRTIVRHILLQFDNWLKRKEFPAQLAP